MDEAEHRFCVTAADPVTLARALLRCPSVTPADAGALGVIEQALKPAHFETHRVTFAEPGTAPVENFFARLGSGPPHLVFAGHTDVVPPGEEKNWKHPPFAGEIENEMLYGRGAVDMKGGIACALAAALDYVTSKNGTLGGSISFLITGDEEGIAVNGTVKLLQWAAARGEKFDHCILGEPSSVAGIADTVKIGRRGSLNGTLIVTGKQGHVAYPERTDNPVRGIVSLIAALNAEPLDRGSENFGPSNLEFTSVDVGNRTVNLIPGEARARFNIRYNDCHSQSGLKTLIEKRARAAAKEHVRFAIEWEPSNADVFLTRPGPFTDLVAGVIAEVAGKWPAFSTAGGTSDARFIKDYCPVVEFGLVGQTMHQVDECTAVRDLVTLTAVYRGILERYFA